MRTRLLRPLVHSPSRGFVFGRLVLRNPSDTMAGPTTECTKEE